MDKHEKPSDQDLQKKYSEDTTKAELFKYGVIFILIPLVLLIKHFGNDILAMIVLALGVFYFLNKGTLRCPKCGFLLGNLAGISFWRQKCIRCGFELEPHADKKKK